MRYVFQFFIYLLLFFLLQNCGIQKVSSESIPIQHTIWDSLLQKYVTEAGIVNYAGFRADSVQLNRYLSLLQNNHPNDKHWSKDAQLAYWLNAYNAFTVQLVMRHYPVASIKDIKNGIPFVNTVWDIKFIHIEGQTYDLNNIEHGIIRKQFDEPRIHFAVNCASVSCPRLRNEAYTADRLDAQLDDQTRYFLHNPLKNRLDTQTPKLSKLFSWYRMDFNKGKNTVRQFINQYTDMPISADAKIDYLDYDWRLSDRVY